VEEIPAKTYVAAITAVRDKIHVKQAEMLRTQYVAPLKKITAPQLATAVGYTTGGVNIHYGRLGHLLADTLGRQPDYDSAGEPMWWSALSTLEHGEAGLYWVMLPTLATALEELGIVDRPDHMLPEEVPSSVDYFEGTVRQVLVNAYERNQEARKQCLVHYGTRCFICNFDFEAVYGPNGKDYIHVHHLRPLSGIGAQYVVDPINDLRPVCPNCHAMIHRHTQAYGIEDVQVMIEEARLRE
jgi:5-methylcytosine-specific restriction enzyme A